MSDIYRSRLGRIAIAASGVMFLLSGTAFAQKVQVFDDAPSMEQLRSIMIPESKPGLGRTIVIQRPDMSAVQAPVQSASSQVMAAPRPPAAKADQSARQVAATTSEAPAAAAAKAEPAAEAGVVGFRINFAFNSAALPDSAHTMIDRIAQIMKEAPQIKIRVEGHTDAVGSADYNNALSEERALSVAKYLAAQGVAPARLQLVGKGKSEPLTSNPYDPANRRVQFVRIG